ncbi:glycosyltransferase family 2 protein [Infirmifilum sp. NZ]|uniref:glycosyltransferase family 2 protein n=1 Tax=Infirmifilum sp. NZ TaxID=2926850 RepID=UPI0027A1030D|nr:glycosyltransferase family A protein [Infirmifilum sp. NZ]UNQ73149.1 glycosyltransferase family 2 protein [Infirmifilum sp. NZ]
MSVIVSTKNNRITIPFVLDSIRRLSKQYIVELIVVDGMSDDGTYQFAANFLAQFKNDFYNVKLLRDPGTSLSLSRNMGFVHSTGDFLVFLDGDMILHPEFVENFGRVLSGEYDAIAPRLEVLRLERFTSIFNAFIDVVSEGELNLNKPSIIPQARIFSRRALSKIHGYPPLSRYFGEDRCATALATIQGMKYVYMPTLRIIKVDEPSFAAYLRKHMRYGEGIEKDLTSGGRRVLRDYIVLRRLTYLNLIAPLLSMLYALRLLRVSRSAGLADFLSVFTMKYTIDLAMLIGEIKGLIKH